jgi:hypothetical protein
MSEIPVDTGTDGAQPAPRRSGFFQFDIIVSLAAIFISAVSLYTGIDNARVQHRLLAASVWPFLGKIVSNSYNESGDIAIGVSNDGVGPAKIKTFELFYRGRPVRSGIDLLQQCCGLGADRPTILRQIPAGFYSSLIDESVLRAGEPNVVLKYYRAKTDPAVMARLSKEVSNVTFRACYCSVLDECWVGDLWTTRTTPVRVCAPPEHPFLPAAR